MWLLEDSLWAMDFLHACPCAGVQTMGGFLCYYQGALVRHMCYDRDCRVHVAELQSLGMIWLRFVIELVAGPGTVVMTQP